MVILHQIDSGKIQIFSVGDQRKSVFRKFVEALEERDKKQVLSIVRQLAQRGILQNTQKFRKIKSSEGYEIKTQNSIRVYCFWVKRNDLKNALIIVGCSKKEKNLSATIEKIEKKIKEINIDLCELSFC